jgi:hypothetical protein
MRFYNNIYASYIRILEELNNRNSRFTAVVLLSASQILDLALLFGLIRYFTGTDLVPYFPSKYQVLIFTLPLLVILFIYYSKERTENILNLYNEKSKTEKRAWKIVSLLIIVIPMALFPFVFRKGV